MTATSHAFMCVHECVLGDAPKCTWKQIYRKMTLLLHVQTIYNLTLLCRRSNSRIWRNNLFLKGRLGGHTIKCVLSSEILKKTKLHFWVQKSWGTKTVLGTVLACRRALLFRSRLLLLWLSLQCVLWCQSIVWYLRMWLLSSNTRRGTCRVLCRTGSIPFFTRLPLCTLFSSAVYPHMTPARAAT